jgi:23S rRNA-/tRNA-specific pseudouridylate synthase
MECGSVDGRGACHFFHDTLSYLSEEGVLIMATSKQSQQQFSEQEAARRRDAVIKQMINTPPKTHSEMKIGKRKNKPRRKT